MSRVKKAMGGLPENLTKSLPGEALVLVGFGEGFIKQNIEDISATLLPAYAISILIAVFLATFFIKYFVITALKKRKIFFALIVSFQAISYSLVIVAGYIFSGQTLIFTIFISVIIGLVLSAVATAFPKEQEE